MKKVLTTKVIGSSSSRWFGYIHLASKDDVEKCIQALHQTELHGKKIYVDRVSSFDIILIIWFITCQASIHLKYKRLPLVGEDSFIDLYELVHFSFHWT